MMDRRVILAKIRGYAWDERQSRAEQSSASYDVSNSPEVGRWLGGVSFRQLGSNRGSAVLSAKHRFAPPSGCPWMDTQGLRGAGTAQRNVCPSSSSMDGRNTVH